MKYLGRNLTKYVQDLYGENYETLVRETIQEINKWSANLCPWIGRLNSVKRFSSPQTVL